MPSEGELGHLTNGLLVRIDIGAEQDGIVDGPETFRLVAFNTGGYFGLTSWGRAGGGGIITNHAGNHTAAGPSGASHAYSGRGTENPSVKIWVK